MPEKLTKDIQLPTEHAVDPRLNAPWQRAVRRQALTTPPTSTRTNGPIRQAVSRATANWRSFTGTSR